ncbi:hypothetical protein KAR91_05000 [Candidatus Pacearchaeota archaeon]|nr:hypothetical protein [Candidatus Pacearchaeota archaeon]
MNNTQILRRINHLIDEYKKASLKSKYDDLSDLDNDALVTNLETRALAIIEHATKKDSVYRRQAYGAGGRNVPIQNLIGILYAIKDDVMDKVINLNENNEEIKVVAEEKYNLVDEKFEFKGGITSKKKYKCFVIMPIGVKKTIEYQNNMAVYKNIIKPCVENSGYKIECYHADVEEFTKSGSKTRQIFEALRDDVIVVADLRRNNKNVIYELGIRNAIGGRTILVCSEYEQSFFHQDNYTAIKYDIYGGSNKEFHERIQSAIDDVILRPNKSDNPVTDHLGKFSPGEAVQVSPEQKWYQNKGGSVCNVFIQLKASELYLRVRNSTKFSVNPKRGELKSCLQAFSKALIQYSTNKIYTSDFPIKNDLQNIARKLAELSRTQASISHDSFEPDAKECLNMITAFISNNLETFKKLGVYLVSYEQQLEEIKEKLERMTIQFEEIDDDIFLVQNEPEITSSCERFARDLNYFSSQEIFNISDDNFNELDEITISLMEIYLPPYMDGGQSMDAFKTSYKKLTNQCKDCLGKMNRAS